MRRVDLVPNISVAEAYNGMAMPTEAFAVGPIEAELPFFSSPSVLVVDDDPEATIPIASILSENGCISDFAFSEEDAAMKLATHWYDLIVLDWQLCNGTGGDFLRSVLRHQSLFEKFRRRVIHGPQLIVTYTARKVADLDIPEGHYFAHVDHWQKPMKYKDIAAKATHLLRELNR